MVQLDRDTIKLQVGYNWAPTKCNLQMVYNWAPTNFKLQIVVNDDVANWLQLGPDKMELKQNGYNPAPTPFKS